MYDVSSKEQKVPDSQFADGIAEITATGGVIRIEFFALSIDRKATPKPGEQPRMQVEKSLTVAMPIAGFVASLKSIDDFRQKLVDNGVIKVAPDNPPAAAADVAAQG